MQIEKNRFYFIKDTYFEIINDAEILQKVYTNLVFPDIISIKKKLLKLEAKKWIEKNY